MWFRCSIRRANHAYLSLRSWLLIDSKSSYWQPRAIRKSSLRRKKWRSIGVDLLEWLLETKITIRQIQRLMTLIRHLTKERLVTWIRTRSTLYKHRVVWRRSWLSLRQRTSTSIHCLSSQVACSQVWHQLTKRLQANGSNCRKPWLTVTLLTAVQVPK